MGYEVYIYVIFDGNDIVFVVSIVEFEEFVLEGDEIKLVFDQEWLYIFDCESG